MKATLVFVSRPLALRRREDSRRSRFHPSAFTLPLDSPPATSVILVLNKQGLDSAVVGRPNLSHLTFTSVQEL